MKPPGWPTGPHKAWEPLYGVQILSHWTPLHVARRLDAGTVWINQHFNLHPNIPFSGHKNSGIGIKFSEDGLKEFCNVQVIANKQ